MSQFKKGYILGVLVTGLVTFLLQIYNAKREKKQTQKDGRY